MDITFVGIEPISLVDYDGHIACTIFVNSCNLRCPFCHNRNLVLNQNLKIILFEEILDYLKKRQNIIDAVCITGGEPTLFSGLKEAIIKIKELGFLVKLDTNGTNPLILKELVNENLIDYVAMDIKNSYKNYNVTTNTNQNIIDSIKESISFIMKSGIDYEFRTTLVKEYHDLEAILDISLMIKGAKRYFLQKFNNSDNCLNHNLHEININEAKRYQTILSSKIQRVSLRGYS